MKRILPSLILCLCFAYGFSQDITVSGKVTDESGEPLVGVSITVKGTTQGTTTDFDGNYAIDAAMGNVLLFSYVGFESKQVTVSSAGLDVQLESGVALENVVVVGSRNPARTATETAVPVDVIDMKELTSQGPQVNLNQILNYVAPSFSSNTQTISDGTDHIDPASLRGLGPDQVLVLINGKRRHTSSLINVNGTFGRGNVGTDLNAIPAAAIQRIEVLRDGAAAQYGSDAIAGVINIVLNKNVNELTVTATTGANFSRNAEEQTGGIDGATTNISANYGLALGDKGGFINFTGDFDYRDDYNRMKEWEGGIFNAYNSIEYVANANGYDISDLFTDVDAIKQYGAQVPYFDTDLKARIAGANSINDMRNALKNYQNPYDPVTEQSDYNSYFYDVTDEELAARGLQRTDFNMRVGQSALRGGRFMANFSLPLDDNGTELYSFAGISSRAGNSAGFYRMPGEARTYTPAYINGFLPEINSKIKDRSLSVGIKGKINEWNVDFSNTYGRNSFDYEISNTSNASMLNASPTRFDAGGFAFTQNTTNLDINRFYEDVFAGLNIAFGAEHRFEKYEITEGEQASYVQYDVNGIPITTDTQQPRTDFFGSPRPGGSQVFPGFSETNALERDRTSIAGYFDVEADLTERFLVSLASRFENYSDFGSTINFKVATRVKATDNLNLRAALNTGFRAPSLHQLYFNSTSTVFDNQGNPQEVGTFANDSRVAKLLGIPDLKEETSKSISVGFTAKLPEANITFTVDGYFVAIDDRIVYTGQFQPGDNEELQLLFNQANASRAAFFSNAIDTESKGLDMVITHKTYLSDNVQLKNDLSATLSQTRRVGDIKASQVLEDAGLVETYFPEESRIYLEEAVPRTKVNLTNNLTTDRFNVFLRNVFFGKVTEATNVIENQQEFGTKIVTDLSFGYKVSDALTLTVGANNLFDIYPDRAFTGDSQPDVPGIQNNRSSGRFDWSRRAQQFGVGGRFLFARLSFVLK
ncbi:TonB-dependent receptor [Sinomicrobium weinanense]|uniref:TonB-dependent receptor n=1 Tax=Sinomicrobium weinanense TaxID=2842200 RepID=A0A926JR78_9FLAO|nr:TonB-dependent receptor [Sinomicrobium weinanense]MBC9796010.1 TonB-dependent receptor [Sinomicrobium weinanense]MBU3123171.1 TonB-dependent receptor [Sinomicrobium weinanense]